MSDSSQREWGFYLDDMIEFAGKVLKYTEDLDQEFPPRNPLANDYRDSESAHSWLSWH